MASEERTSGVSMVKAFERDPDFIDEGRLVYPNLESFALNAHDKEYPLFHKFLEAGLGTLTEEGLARDAASDYQVLTGMQLQRARPEHQKLVSDRFTEASIELYGEPETEEFQKILSAKLAEFRGYIKNPRVNQIRDNQILEILQSHQIENLPELIPDTSDFDKAIKETAYRLVEELKVQFADVLSIFDDLNPKEILSVNEVADLYELALDILQIKDPAWVGWTIERNPDKESFDTEEEFKKIIVGMKRNPITVTKAEQLFIHEALTHALRSVNGSKTGETMMQYGLPDYLAAEEGLAVFLEYGLTGKIPNTRTDIYLDFGLALGTSGKPALTRTQLQQLYVSRNLVRAEAQQKAVDEGEVQHDGWRHVNRIFRGALDNDVTAVNTKDLAYYHGFIKIGDYVIKALQAGVSEAELLDYLMCGKFDPTNEQHTSLVETLI